MRFLPILLSLCLAATLSLGHGSTEKPPPPEDPPSRPPGGGGRPDPRANPPPPPPIPPESPPTSGPRGRDPGHPPAPEGGAPPPPTRPPDGPGAPETPRTRPAVRPDILTRRRGTSGGSWRLWWEYNREHLLGLRGLLRRKVTITGRDDARLDPLGASRPRVLEALRRAARGDPERLVRAAALIALGRMGTDDDARLFVEVLKDGKLPREVHEAAAVGLGILPALENAAMRGYAGAYVAYALQYRKVLPDRARGMLFLAAGLRARGDLALRTNLVTKMTTKWAADGQEAAHLALAGGLMGDPMIAPELLRGARKGEFGGKRLTDIERAHVVGALALLGDPLVTETLVKVLQSRRSRLQTKRSAALALGRILREQPANDVLRARAGRALRQAFEKENDSLLRGFCALGLGAARPPHSLPVLMTAIDHGGNMEVKPYCALALGLAARTLGPDESGKVRRFLAAELDKTNHAELGSALSIALGLARATEAEKVLLERLQRRRLRDDARGAAAQGLGLLGNSSPESAAALTRIVKTEVSSRLLGDAALALGLLGRRDVALDLARALPRSSTAQVQARIMLALSYLNHSETVEPLLEVLANRKNRSLIREFAAVALGLMGDRRENDLLFAIDAWFNLQATTPATREWMRLY